MLPYECTWIQYLWITQTLLFFFATKLGAWLFHYKPSVLFCRIKGFAEKIKAQYWSTDETCSHRHAHTHTDIPLFKDLFLKIPFSSGAFNQVHDESVLHTNMQYPLFVISLFCNLDGSQWNNLYITKFSDQIISDLKPALNYEAFGNTCWLNLCLGRTLSTSNKTETPSDVIPWAMERCH